MKYPIKTLFLRLVGGAVCAGILLTLPPREYALGADDALVVPAFKKVVLVIFENEDIDKPLRLKFFSRLAKEGALLNNYHAVTHPSQPNYIALTSGDTQGVADDYNHDLPVRHLGDLLEDKGKTWRNYAENFPGNCYLGARQGRYTRKHTPFISYTDVSKTERCANIVDASRFADDLKNGNLPDFSFYTPNMDDDAHDTGILFGERWFRRYFGPLLTEPNFKDILLIVTFDENGCNTIGPTVTKAKLAKCKGDSNQVYTVFYGRGVKGGTVSNVSYDHYSLIRTLEAGFGLETLGKQDEKASPISGIWE